MLSCIFLTRKGKSRCRRFPWQHKVLPAVTIVAYVQSGNHMSMKRASAECECFDVRECL